MGGKITLNIKFSRERLAIEATITIFWDVLTNSADFYNFHWTFVLWWLLIVLHFTQLCFLFLHGFDNRWWRWRHKIIQRIFFETLRRSSTEIINITSSHFLWWFIEKLKKIAKWKVKNNKNVFTWTSLWICFSIKCFNLKIFRSILYHCPKMFRHHWRN